MDLEITHDGVPVTILAGPYVAEEAPTSEALLFITSLVDRLDEIRRYAARRKLLRLYNESWRDENQSVLDEDGLVANLTNPTMTIMDGLGAATVYFDDGDMFAGHLIEVLVQNGEIFGVDIIG